MGEEKEKIKCSVIIPTKNGGGIFQQVLNKVLDQEIDGIFEVVIIDSGSKDGTVEFIESIRKENKKVILRKIAPNDFGHGKTRNLGASYANGEYLVFITQDALPFDNAWLKNLISIFDEDSEVVGVFGKHIPYDDCDIFEKDNINRHFLNFGLDTTIFYLDDKERYERDEGYRHLLCFYSDNSSAMRKSIWEKTPYPDVDFAEDQLWAKKIIEQGYKKAYAPHSIVYHSHKYSLKEQFRRYYDEYKGLNKIYNYVPVKSIFLLPAYIFRHWKSDIQFIKESKSLTLKEKKYWRRFSLAKNIVRYLGAYLGVKGNLFPWLNMVFSREHKLINKDG
ncbi:glycosyltransferase family 2 protein [Aneurinibacillus uraniidurans]|uniref:glycosyltransferase family 2 protein n=1 Tax=Aneurinibacillus uraniidurans TaxID=2966586 RepID=UPI00234B94BE|nr:glycosyltransferase family 2 protein [Aneurinibacillus sp. B1]WCN38094.1 glycosyltransferase family 2 protein [Aneurinibacillus sp. B1]